MSISSTWSWNIGATEAGLSANVNNEGIAGTGTFYLSTSPDFADAQIDAQDIQGVNGNEVGFHHGFGGLTPATHYYWKAVFANDIGESSLTGEFTTAAGSAEASPPQLIKTWSWSIGRTVAGLSAECINFNRACTTRYEWSTRADFVGAQTANDQLPPIAATGVQFHQQLEGLQPGVAYYYRATCANELGSDSKTGEFTTRP